MTEPSSLYIQGPHGRLAGCCSQRKGNPTPQLANTTTPRRTGGLGDEKPNKFTFHYLSHPKPHRRINCKSREVSIGHEKGRDRGPLAAPAGTTRVSRQVSWTSTRLGERPRANWPQIGALSGNKWRQFGPGMDVDLKPTRVAATPTTGERGL